VLCLLQHSTGFGPQQPHQMPAAAGAAPLGPPPPELVLVEGPGDAAPAIAVVISPSSVFSRFDDEPPPNRSCAEPFGGAPPELVMQEASRFSWPPDSQQEWTYIHLPPHELACTCKRTLNRSTTPLEVAEFFASSRAAESSAYAAYAFRWRRDIEALLVQPTGR
jgi:hypothetical protein